MRAGRMRLAVGPGALAWVAYGVLCVLTLPLWLLLLGALVNLVQGGGLLAAALLMLSLIICGVVVGVGMWLYQRAYWLEGTVLVQRRIGRARKCDLSSAWVSAETVSANVAGRTPPLPRLVAWHDGQRPIRLWLRDPDRRSALLPPPHLLALAEAISAGRGHDPRVEPIVVGLRRMAMDPFGTGFSTGWS